MFVVAQVEGSVAWNEPEDDCVGPRVDACLRAELFEQEVILFNHYCKLFL